MAPSSEQHPGLHLRLEHAPRAAGQARSAARDHYAERLDGESLDALLLIVSELVTNAVKYGEGVISVDLELSAGCLRGEVVDCGPGFEAELRDAEVDDLGGRGLPIVARLARRWGVFDGSSHVWFELSSGGGGPTIEPQLRPPEHGFLGT